MAGQPDELGGATDTHRKVATGYTDGRSVIGDRDKTTAAYHRSGETEERFAPARGRGIRCRVEAELSAIGKAVPAQEWAKVPADYFANLDHYLHGAPKKK